MEKAGSKAALAAPVVLHAEKAEAKAAVAASVVEQLVKEGVEPSVEEPEVEDLKKAEAEAGVAVADLEKGEADAAGEDLQKAEADAVVAEDGGAVVAAPVLSDIAKAEEEAVEQKAEAEFVVAEEGEVVGAAPVVADLDKGKEEVVVPEAELKDGFTAWVAEQSDAAAGSNKRKFEELGEPVYPFDSDGSLEYDSIDSAESVDARNVGSFKRKLLEQLRGGSMRYVKHGRYTCPWHARKPKCGTKTNLRLHASELCHTGASPCIRAEHQTLLVALEENAQE